MQYALKRPADEISAGMNEYLVVDNIKSGKISSKEGVVALFVEGVSYHYFDEVYNIEPFEIKCPILQIINNIICVSDENYYSVYSCGKNG